MFNAKAYIQKSSREELAKYLDVPATAIGDLFYINNLVTTIEAVSNGSSTPAPTPQPTLTTTTTPAPTPTPIPSIPGDANGDRHVDDLDYTIWANNYGITNATGPRQGDFNNDHRVDDLDYTIWANNYGK